MESDGLRERREREFQRRVLAAIERPKSNRFWAFINSAAFLWLASAIVLTGGGWYITRQKLRRCCRKIAECNIRLRFQIKLPTQLYRRTKCRGCAKDQFSMARMTL
jgi:hypothetical protein